MLTLDRRAGVFGTYQQTGVVRLWDATSGLWLRDVADPRLTQRRMTAFYVDTAVTPAKKSRGPSNTESEAPAILLGAMAGDLYAFYGERSSFDMLYAHPAPVLAITATPNLQAVYSVDGRGNVYRAVWSDSPQLLNKCNITGTYRDISIPTDLSDVKAYLGVLQNGILIVVYDRFLIALAETLEIKDIIPLASHVTAFSSSDNCVFFTLADSAFVHAYTYNSQIGKLRRFARLLLTEDLLSIMIKPLQNRRYAIVTTSPRSLKLFVTSIPKLEELSSNKFRPHTSAPLIEAGRSIGETPDIIGGTLSVTATKIVIFAICGTITLPSVVSIVVDNDSPVFEHFKKDSFLKIPSESTGNTVTMTLPRVVKEFIDRGKVGDASRTNDTRFQQFTRFNKLDNAIQTAIPAYTDEIRDLAVAESGVGEPKGFKKVGDEMNEEDLPPIEQIIQQRDFTALNDVLIHTTEWAIQTTVKLFSEDSVYVVLDALLSYATKAYHREQMEAVVRWLRALRGRCDTSNPRYPAISRSFISLFGTRISYQKDLRMALSYAEKLI
ncbi:hypothetical protein GMRT_10883 [Giardia muris]|uniref:Uncharacterized protein n=1 Tax=Giardia muris TaxID=5742 RepID=A0A4Z1T804_GIAMU|nr:hypothetical protein GMRT_10883 [Giardia muris]|eukprot:TNJ28621.1 hypothetical protein GMRT_10883 [Giardia muris]